MSRGRAACEIVGGFCRICGDTAEWIMERGLEAVLSEDEKGSHD